jgi:RNA polymerase sigma factor (sigma-70 family)
VQHSDESDVTDSMLEITDRPIAIVVDPNRVLPRSEADLLVERAFAEHADRLTAFAMASVRDRDVADDLVGETFLRYLQEVRAGRLPDNVAGWLHRVLGNLAISRGRRLQVARRMLTRLWEPGEGEDSPESAAIRHDQNDRTVDALGRLPPDARVALLLAAQGHDMASIAQAIGRSPSATRTYVCRMRVRLRDELSTPRPAGSAAPGVEP